ncbi:MAG TPA: hypothetical protein VFZ66_17300 [Herpetosiphonaceae bacterium]
MFTNIISEVIMGDWDDWSEHDETVNRFVDSDPDRRSLMCYIDSEDIDESDIEEEVWSWHPGHRVRGWLTRIHTEFQIGSDLFLARQITVPEAGEEDTTLANHGDHRVIGRVIYQVVQREEDARFEVIIMSRADIARLNAASRQLNGQVTSMKEGYFVGMIDALVSFMHEHADMPTFVFSRQI